MTEQRMDSSLDGNPLDYFESYQDLNIHELMLRDVARNKAYKKAVFDNKNHFKDKVVLDVGTGTGILSIFCAQAGASKIYAVEASSIYKIAQQIVNENQFEHVIQVIHSKIEDVILPEKVDIIISEWMGFYLLHESMLDSVIIAKDKFLKPGGLMFPESATLYSAPCSIPSMYEDWRDVEGISMLKFAEALRQTTDAAKKPITTSIKSEQILCDPEVVTWIDLRELTIADLESIKVQHVTVANKSGKYQGICLWFTVMFPSYETEPVILSTDPEDPETHWKQTIILLPMEIEVEQQDPLAYEISLTKTLQRRYNIEVTMLDPDETEHPELCGCHMTKCILTRAVLENYKNN